MFLSTAYLQRCLKSNKLFKFVSKYNRNAP